VQGGAASEGRIIFNRNEQDPLEVDVLIIDEMSMVDLPLMNALLQAIEVGTRVIFVGDCNQLPSVGPGKILKDIIDSETFSSVILTEIFRQASGSDIVVNAHKIQRGEALSLDNKSEDFFFLKRDNPEKVIQVMLTLIVKKLPKYVGATAFDIQVLSPMRKGTLGVENLNKVLQMHLNPKDDKKPEIESHEHNYRQGDKVMQIKNNYDLIWKIRTERGLVIDEGLGIFNGDMGIITEIDNYADTLTVEFDEHRLVEYQMKQLEELEHAYAVTVHKSQGSEYPAVVIPLLSGPHQLYNRNLIYTAITRAKKCVTIVGSEEVLKNMVQNTTEQKRNTSLAERIVELDIQ
jgi:exodeoxyribonuclease V alpha subunit